MSASTPLGEIQADDTIPFVGGWRKRNGRLDSVRPRAQAMTKFDRPVASTVSTKRRTFRSVAWGAAV